MLNKPIKSDFTFASLNELFRRVNVQWYFFTSSEYNLDHYFHKTAAGSENICTAQILCSWRLYSYKSKKSQLLYRTRMIIEGLNHGMSLSMGSGGTSIFFFFLKMLLFFIYLFIYFNFFGSSI